ncbi:MAG: hypothetical protein BroJett018_36460 [Chloroflexota bacterium]|nr:GNAT family N-acetyltransferase [Chloroflexota bacterium]NOG64096.1 GNAT family N-acetyltransferase [Chloroflexota bacterium]GIK65852.1 MAG: hypothetical protein BroJett018_36460 [Chloroflexota bacterium]
MSKTKKLRRPLTPREKATKKPFIPSLLSRVLEKDIELIEGKGTKKSGGEEGGHYWHIFYNGKRAGRVFINLVHSHDSNSYPAITVEINANMRGIGIGTIAFRKACELSKYDEIFASIRKSNTASRIAAERAGFKEIEESGTGISMVWRRKK